MIRFENWTIQADGDILARQFDNLTRTLTVAGDIPAGWEWAVLVQVGEAMDIIPLTVTEGALSAVLTAQQLSIAGYYQMQLRATQGDKVQHTNTVNVYIPASLSGDEQWPTVPSEFSDMERRISEKAAQVEGYATHPPVVGENGNWWEWDGTAYVDTGKPSQGERGEQGIQGPPGCTPQKGVDYFTEDDKQEVIGQAESRFNTLYSNALKGTVRGATVRLDDVSPLEHGVPVRVSGKNLIPYPYRETTKTVNGVTFTDNGDGTITANGTATKDATFSCHQWSARSVPAGAYTFFCANVSGVSRANIALKTSGSTGTTVVDVRETGTPIVFETQDDAGSIYLELRIIKDATVENFVFKPQLELGTTATAYTPYVDDLTAVTLTKAGLNIWDEQWELGTVYNSGNTASATDTIRSKNFIPVKAGVKLCFTLPQMARTTYYDTNKTAYNSFYPKPGTSATPAQDGYIKFAIGGNVGSLAPITEYGNNICISVFNEVTKGIYEPYKGETYIPNEDSTCEVTSIAPTMTLLTDTPGVVIDCEYNRDINKAFEQLTQAIISMGGNI